MGGGGGSKTGHTQVTELRSNPYETGVTRPSLLKSIDTKPFFRKILQKIIEDLYLSTKKSEICIFFAI